jgi:hypothetical protein
MGSLSVKLPRSIHRHAKRLAENEGVSINQLISAVVAEKISAIDAERHLAERSARGSVSKFRRVLSKVPQVAPDSGDELKSD